MIIFKLWK